MQFEVLGQLVLADDLAYPHADLVRPLQAPLLALRGRYDGLEQRLGGPSPTVAVLPPLYCLPTRSRRNPM